MPFKIVSTRRSRRVELTAVPSRWETKGKLRWPRKNADELVRQESSQPHPDWLTVSCVLKRRNIPSYESAEEELASMLERTDSETDFDEHFEDNVSHCGSSQERNKQNNCSSMSRNLVTSQQSSLSTTDENRNPPHAANNGTVYDVIESTSETPQTVTMGDILNNINNLYQTQNTILENQVKIMNKLEKISIHLEDRRNQYSLAITVDQDNSHEKDRLTIKPIDNVEELEEFEKLLSNQDTYKELQQKYSILFPVASGSGITCAYRLLDTLFSKEFLCKCSWTGGSRGESTKYCFKVYKNVLSFFFEMVHTWDCTYTVETHENFIKMVLKNAVRRKQMKNLRTSTKKNRRTKRQRMLDMEQEKLCMDAVIEETNNGNDIPKTPNYNSEDGNAADSENYGENDSLC